MDDLEYKAYLKERKTLVNAKLEEAKLFDKAILTLAAGVSGLSLAFIKQIAPEPKPATMCLLVATWGTFSGSILSTLISFLTSQSACSKQLEILDKWYKNNNKETKKNKNRFATYTKILNWTSMALFIIGVIFLIAFSKLNL